MLVARLLGGEAKRRFCKIVEKRESVAVAKLDCDVINGWRIREGGDFPSRKTGSQ